MILNGLEPLVVLLLSMASRRGDLPIPFVVIVDRMKFGSCDSSLSVWYCSSFMNSDFAVLYDLFFLFISPHGRVEYLSLDRAKLGGLSSTLRLLTSASCIWMEPSSNLVVSPFSSLMVEYSLGIPDPTALSFIPICVKCKFEVCYARVLINSFPTNWG